MSSRFPTPSPVLAETWQTTVEPPHSSGVRFSACSCCITLSGLAVGRSHLLMATMSVTCASRACWIASRVWGMMPSSAAMMMTAMSVRCAPRLRIALKAAWPGVSRNVIWRPWTSTE